MIAGIAISALLNMKGELAMAMACAAFCIPTSMTMVLLTAVPDFVMRESKELQVIAANIKIVIVNPNTAKFSLMACVFCKKKIPANVIKAGNASLLSTLLTFAAGSGRKCLNVIPKKSGTNSNTMFCTMSLPKGRLTSTPLCSVTKRATNSIMTGIVNNVIMLLMAVSVTDKATSPFANMENTFDELPPGQQAMSTMPMKYTGGNFKAQAKAKAMSGRIII